MAIGYVRDELDLKILIMYIMNHVCAPIDLETITKLTMCDEGVDYFSFTSALNDLVENENLKLRDGKYEISDKGRRNSLATEDSIVPSLKKKCDSNLLPLNTSLRQEAQIKSNVIRRADGSIAVEMLLDDSMGNLMTLTLLAASEAHAEVMASNFKKSPELIYNGILDTIMKTY